MELPEKIIKLRSLNPHIVCMLCAGYFVEATTIIECLHTFCKSCIVRYLQSSKYCPTCGTLVHVAEPLTNIKTDRTMQDIMDKILPNIRADEEKREVEFFKKIGNEEAERDENNSRVIKDQIDLSAFPSTLKCNEQFNICLELDRNGELWFDQMEVGEIVNKYIRCPGRVKIMHIKKLVRKLYAPHFSNFELKIKCNDVELNNMEHLKLVYVVYWKRRPQPVVLYYKFERLNGDTKLFSDNHITKIQSDAEINSNSAEEEPSNVAESLNEQVDGNEKNSFVADTSDVSNSASMSSDLDSSLDASGNYCIEDTVSEADEHGNIIDSEMEPYESCNRIFYDESLLYNSHRPCVTVT